MKILAFDTSSTACSVAIQTAAHVEVQHRIAPLQQAKLILPIIHELLAKCSLTIEELDAIIYGAGPGSFTGLRIAASVAQGIAFVAGKPVIPVSSLAAIAQAAHIEQQCDKQMVAVDARMGQIYWGLYQTGQDGCVELEGKEVVCEPAKIHVPKGHDWSAAGDGWEIYQQALEAALGFKPAPIYTGQLPTAQALLQLGKAKLERGEWVPATAVAPVYLR